MKEQAKEQNMSSGFAEEAMSWGCLYIPFYIPLEYTTPSEKQFRGIPKWVGNQESPWEVFHQNISICECDCETNSGEQQILFLLEGIPVGLLASRETNWKPENPFSGSKKIGHT